MSLSETDHSEKIYTWMEIDNLVRKLRTHTSHAPTYHIIDEAAKDIKTLNTVSIGELKKILYDYHRLIKLLF